jgi:hypothetical protein
MYAEFLRDTFPEEIKFLPDLFAYGNYFQPGRFTRRGEWEVPKYV